jgi:uncharacterized repeat protein (TIGR01451 family)
LVAVATACVAVLTAATAAFGDISATSSGGGLTATISTSAPVLSGVAADYTISVTNTSTAPIPSVTAFVQLPDGMTLKAAAANCTKNPFGGRSTVAASCSFGTLAPGASGSAVVSLVAPAPGTFTVEADVSGQIPLGPDTIQFVGTSTILSVPVSPGPADIQVTGSSNNGSPPVGSPFSYTFQVKDNGSQGAYGVTFDDALPSSIALSSVSTNLGTCTAAAGSVHCDLGNLAVGQQATITITAVPTATGTVTDIAAIAMLGPDTQPANNTVGVTVQPK